jgi:hypothetical protein
MRKAFHLQDTTNASHQISRIEDFSLDDEDTEFMVDLPVPESEREFVEGRAELRSRLTFRNGQQVEPGEDIAARALGDSNLPAKDHDVTMTDAPEHDVELTKHLQSEFKQLLKDIPVDDFGFISVNAQQSLTDWFSAYADLDVVGMGNALAQLKNCITQQE